MFKNLKVRTKLIVCFALLGTMALVIGGVNAIYLNKISHVDVKGMQYLNSLKLSHKGIAMSERGLSIRLFSGALRNAQYDEIKASRETITASRQGYFGGFLENKKDSLWVNYSSVWQDWKSQNDSIVNISKKRDALIKNGAMVEDQEIIQIDGDIVLRVLETEKLHSKCDALLDLLINTQTKKGLAHALWGQMITVILMAMFLAMTIIMGILLYSSIVSPLFKGLNFARIVASGDLTQRLDIKSKDELGSLSTALNDMTLGLKNIVGEITSVLSPLTKASSNLSSVSGQISDKAKDMTTISGLVAQSCRESSDNTAAVSVASKELSGGISTVATAIEEMNSSLNEVAKNMQKESQVVKSADSQIHSIGSRMNELKAAAKEIGKVLKFITEVADQTNLLSLNATIEAASAGDAGKGFAVVANEVKELAKKTKTATDEIKLFIDKLNLQTDEAVKEIQSITHTVEDISSISFTTVSAVEEQSATVNEIARTVGSADNSASEISRKVSDSAKGISEVSNGIQKVDTAAKETSAGIVGINTDIAELTKLSENLRNIVNKFKI